jgi:serine/threonine protein phosphatase PrpC
MTTYNAYGATDTGMKRSQNQDSIALHSDFNLFLVADGMGGHRGGETASKMAVDIIPSLLKEWSKNSDSNRNHLLAESIRGACSAIFQYAVDHPELQGMGTTSVGVWFENDKASIANVGDSRCYFFQNKNLWQISRDHSLVQDKLRAGIITREQLKSDKTRNVITRCVGFESNVEVDLFEIETMPGDVFLLCSDGLTGQLSDEEISSILTKMLPTSSLEEITNHLIQLANEHGGDDNISVVLIQVMK